MNLLDTLTIQSSAGERYIELYHGDLTALTPEEAVDVLVVSAFPDDYCETKTTTLIGALSRKNISVSRLAADKEVDLRQSFSCWLSREIITSEPGIQFKRILCFEPLMRGRPPEMVGDIFRALAPFLGGPSPVSTVALPLVSCGDMGVAVAEMLLPLLEAAANWLALGLPLRRFKIVAFSEGHAREALAIFRTFKASRQPQPSSYDEVDPDPHSLYDIFVSYSHANADDVANIVDELHQLRPGLRIFLDRNNLNVGSAWQYEIFEALDASRRVLVVYSPQYLDSKVCKEEFNIAWARNRDAEEKVLFPIYLYSSQLPTYMKLCQYKDCREGNKEIVRDACKELLSDMFGQQQVGY